MKIEVEINKKYFIVIMTTILVLAGAFLAVSYGTSNPAVFGHSAGEIPPISNLTGDSVTINAKNVTFISPNGMELRFYERITNDGTDFYGPWSKNPGAGASPVSVRADTCDGNPNSQYACPANAYKDCIDNSGFVFRYVSCRNESQRVEYVMVDTPDYS